MAAPKELQLEEDVIHCIYNIYINIYIYIYVYNTYILGKRRNSEIIWLIKEQNAN